MSKQEGNMEYRRRAPRVTTGWPGRYIVEDDPHSGWNECRVLDISLIGVGLELFGDTDIDLLGHQLIVHVQTPVGESVSIRLVGRVMNTGRGNEGGTRAGLEFVGLSDTEQSILKALELMRVTW
jgi:hypothetical protein